MKSGWGVLIGAALLALALLFGDRFTIVAGSDGRIWRMDRVTGETWSCGTNADAGIVYCDRYQGRSTHGQTTD